MLFKSLINLLIIFVSCFFKTTKSDIENCSFLNTVNITTLEPDTNNTYLYDNSTKIPSNLVDDYNYEILKNGTKIMVPAHKRGCICPDPCIRFCSNLSLEMYCNEDGYNFAYTKDLQLNNGSQIKKHLIFDFNYRIEELADCNNTYKYHLEPEKNDKHKWILLENLTLLINYKNVYLNQNQYCFEIISTDDNQFFINPMLCGAARTNPPNVKIKSYAMALSTPFFMLTIFIYCLLPQLRNCHGKCFIMYLIFLALSYLLLCAVTLSETVFDFIPCLILGYSIYFTTIAFLTWISLISYDTWKTLTRFVVRSSFRKYLILGFIIPSIATSLTFLAQTLKIVPDKLKPDIQKNSCGVNTTRPSAMLYYYIPHIIVLSYSLSKYITVLRYIHKNESGVRALVGSIKKSHKKRFFLYFRLIIFMGVTWILDVLSYLLQQFGNENFIVVADLLTALNGLFVFITFICRPSILQKLKRRFSHRNNFDHGMVTMNSLDIDAGLETAT